MDEISLIMKQSNNGNYFVKPFCDFFKIDFDNQVKRIKNDMICQTDTGKNTDKLLFGDEIPRLTLSKRSFVRWIQLINPQILQVSLRDKFIQFQANIFEYIYSGTSNKLQFLEDMQAINAEANRLRSERGKLGKQIQTLNKTLATMQDIGENEWQNQRNFYLQLPETTNQLTQ